MLCIAAIALATSFQLQIDAIASENRRLGRQVQNLELVLMVCKYRQGARLPTPKTEREARLEDYFEAATFDADGQLRSGERLKAFEETIGRLQEGKLLDSYKKWRAERLSRQVSGLAALLDDNQRLKFRLRETQIELVQHIVAAYPYTLRGP